MRRKVLAAALASALSGLVMAVAPASPALAISYCNQRLSLPETPGVVAYVPGAGGSYKCYLFQGDGPDDGVKALQHAINVCYIDAGFITGVARLVEDGQFGAKTKSALMAVQRWSNVAGYHISVDGNYGPQTYNAMTFPGSDGPPGCWVVSAAYPW